MVEWEVIFNYDLRKLKLLKEDNSCVCYLSFDEEVCLKGVLKVRDLKIKWEWESGNKYWVERGYLFFFDLNMWIFVDYLELLVILVMNIGMWRGELFLFRW